MTNSCRSTVHIIIILLATISLLIFTLVLQEKTIDNLTREIEILHIQNIHNMDELILLDRQLQELKNNLEAINSFLDKFEVNIFETTAYTLSCGNGDGYTATMTIPEAGRTIAVDPKVIPLGSKVLVQGNVYIAEDVGGAIKGHRLDIYKGADRGAYTRAIQYGRQYDVPVAWVVIGK
jgi:3D (Asp-Asp-Asp) domain-containing protein